MLKKIPISIAAISLVEGLKIHQDEESNVQIAEESEWNASLDQTTPSTDAAVEINDDSKKNKKKHHKSKKHSKVNKEASLLQKDDQKNQVPAEKSTALNKNDKKSIKTSIPACTSVECKKESEVVNWNVPTVDHPLSEGHVYQLDQKKGAEKSDSIPACTSIGCKTESIAKPPGPNYPVDYKVPDNGQDKDIEHSIQHLKDAEKALGNWDYPPKADAKIQLETSSIPACSSAGCKTGTAAPKTKDQKDKHPVDYKVANFGVDKDIMATEQHLKDMEAKFGQWDYKKQVADSKKAKEYPVDYKVPSYGADPDIAESLESLGQAEKTMGKKWVVNMQSAADVHIGKEAKAKSDPNHGTGDGCNNFNLDGTRAEKCGSKKPTHDANGIPLDQVSGTLTMKQLVNNQIKNELYPTEDSENGTELMQKSKKAHSVAQVKKMKSASPSAISDPIHGTGDGCVGYNDDGSIGKKCASPSATGDGHPINYPVPNLGLDKDIKDSQSHEKQATDGKWAPGSTETPQAPAPEEKKPEAKAQLGTKVDINMKDDPICGSGSCKTYPNPYAKTPDYPMNYKVQDLGMDHEIAASISHEKDAIEGRWAPGTEPDAASSLATHADVHMQESLNALNSNWNPDRDDQGTWMAPVPNTLAGTKIDIHLESDPVCTSVGCETGHTNPSEEEAWKKIGYSPLDAPLDKDVQDSKNSADEAAIATGKEWSILQTGTEVHTKNKVKTEQKAETVAKAKQTSKTQEKSTAHTKQKSAIKAKTATKQKVEAKAKEQTETNSEAQVDTESEVKTEARLQTKAEKADTFAQMREKMMSNWGFKS